MCKVPTTGPRIGGQGLSLQQLLPPNAVCTLVTPKPLWGRPQPVCHKCCMPSSQWKDFSFAHWGTPSRLLQGPQCCPASLGLQATHKVLCHTSCEAQIQTIVRLLPKALESPKTYDTGRLVLSHCYILWNGKKAHLSRELPEPCQAQAGQCHSGPRAWIQCRKSGLESQLQHKHRNSILVTELTSLYLNFFVYKWGEHILVAVNATPLLRYRNGPIYSEPGP